MTWADAEPWLIPAQLCAAMIGMGLTLSRSDFAELTKRPGTIAATLAVLWVAAPLLALAYTNVLGMAPGWQAGIVLFAAQPGGAYSNLLTYFGRGHLATSITLTATATAACIVVTPLLLNLLIGSAVSIPIRYVAREVGLFLLLPLGIGMFFHAKLGTRRTEPLSKLFVGISVVLVMVLVVGMTTQGRIKVAAYGFGPPLAIFGFACLIHGISVALFKALRMAPEVLVAASTETTVRNGALGLLLCQLMFVGDAVSQAQVLYATLFFSGIQPIPTLFIVLKHRKAQKSEAAPSS